MSLTNNLSFFLLNLCSNVLRLHSLPTYKWDAELMHYSEYFSFINVNLYMMTGNALMRSFVGWAALAVERACTITDSVGETDAILQKVSKLERFETFTFINSKEPVL